METGGSTPQNNNFEQNSEFFATRTRRDPSSHPNGSLHPFSGRRQTPLEYRISSPIRATHTPLGHKTEIRLNPSDMFSIRDLVPFFHSSR